MFFCRPVASRPNLSVPILQPMVLREAESFVCRRCRSNPRVSHEAFDAPYHFHPEYELILVENSHGTRYVADSIEPYHPGDLVFIGANVPHVFERQHGAGANGEPETSIVVHFRSDFMGPRFFEAPEMLPARQLLAASVHGLHYDAEVSKWVAPRLGKLLRAQGLARISLLLEILGHLAAAQPRSLASGAFAKQIELKDHARLDRVLAYISENFDRNINLASAAKVAALSPTSFSRWFKHATSKSFVECVTEIRLSHAFRLLTETSKNVTEIAFDCGFNSVSHFIHRFQDVRGMSPREFRRRATAGGGAEPAGER